MATLPNIIPKFINRNLIIAYWKRWSEKGIKVKIIAVKGNIYNIFIFANCELSFALKIISYLNFAAALIRIDSSTRGPSSLNA